MVLIAGDRYFTLTYPSEGSPPFIDERVNITKPYAPVWS